jgi:hypothetical protein
MNRSSDRSARLCSWLWRHKLLESGTAPRSRTMKWSMSDSIAARAGSVRAVIGHDVDRPRFAKEFRVRKNRTRRDRMDADRNRSTTVEPAEAAKKFSVATASRLRDKTPHVARRLSAPTLRALFVFNSRQRRSIHGRGFDRLHAPHARTRGSRPPSALESLHRTDQGGPR